MLAEQGAVSCIDSQDGMPLFTVASSEVPIVAEATPVASSEAMPGGAGRDLGIVLPNEEQQGTDLACDHEEQQSPHQDKRWSREEHCSVDGEVQH